MSKTKHCPKCGGPLAPEAAGGYCSKCLAALAFGLDETLVSDVAAESAPAATGPGLHTPSPALHYFGDYELIEEIARGGMGVVWKARQVSLNRVVAVKMLLSGQFSSPEFIRRFRTEAEAAANLQHPNIVPIHEVGEHEGRQYFSMDYIAGRNLAERSRAGPLPAEQAAVWVRTIAEAVHHAHQRGILHRDLKPSNILLDPDGQPHITDFGLAKLLNADRDLTATGEVMGTPGFMPPEQADPRRGQVTVASDVYSLGAILYHLITGRPPFAGETPIDTLHQVVHGELVPPRLLNTRTPRDLETLCLKALDKEPRRRYAGALELADELGRFLRHEPIRARPISLAGKLWRWCLRKPAVAALTAMAIALGLVGAVAVTWQWRRAETANQFTLDANVRLSDTLQRMELQRAEDLFTRDDAPHALALIARVLRRNPTNLVAAERLLSALSLRSFPPLPSQKLNDIDLWEISGLSPDWRRAVRTSQLYDLHTGETNFNLTVPGRALGPVAFSPDGRRVATPFGENEDWKSIATIRVWDLAGEMAHMQFQHPGGIRDVGFNRDGHLLGTAVIDGGTRIWDTRTGRLLTEFAAPGRGETSEFEFSPDGRFVARAWPEDVPIWHLHTGQPATNLFGEGGVEVTRFNLDGSKVAILQWRTDVSIRDVRTGATVDLEPATGCAGTDARFSRDGSILLTFYDERVWVWRSDDGKPVGRPLQHDQFVRYAGFTADDLNVLTVTQDGTMRVWDPMSGRPLSERFRRPWEFAGPPDAPSRIVFSPDGQWLLTLGDPYSGWGQPYLWDLRPRGMVGTPLADAAQAYFTQFSPDGELVLTASQEWTVQIREARSGKLIRSFAPPTNDVAGQVTPRFSPDSRRVLLAWKPSELEVWDIGSGRSVTGPLDTGSTASRAEFSSDSQKLVVATVDSARVWAVESGRLLSEVRYPAYSRDEGRPFSPDGTRFVNRPSINGPVTVWHLPTGKALWQLQRGAEKVSGQPIFGSDGRRLLLVSDAAVSVWNAETGAELFPPLRHSENVASAEFSPDNRRILTASADKTARVWDAQDGRLLAEIVVGERLRSARFSPDGRRIATAEEFGLADDWERRSNRLWDAQTGLALSEPFGSFVEFSPDGRRLLTAEASEGGGVRIWDLPRATMMPPPWLSSLAEAVGGKRLNAADALENVPFAERRQLRDRLAGLAGTDPFATWIRWFFAEQSTRTTSPFGNITLTEHVQRCIEHRLFLEAALLSPTNFLAFSKLAESFGSMDGVEGWTNSPTTQFGWNCQRALQLKTMLQNIPLRPATARAALLDLTIHYNAGLGEGWHADLKSDLRALKPGVQTLGGTEFDVRGLIQLGGRSRDGLRYPIAAHGIAAGQTCRHLHFLHGAILSAPPTNTAALGSYGIRYADGETVRIPIAHGRDTAAVGGTVDTKLPVVAWEGPSDPAFREGRKLRLFKLTWPNPRPEQAIETIDFTAGGVEARPFLVAITAEP